MAKKLSNPSQEYVDIVNDLVNQTGLKGIVEFKVLNLNKSKKEVIKIQKANEIVELALNKEDVVVVQIYEKAFDLVDDETKRLWIENALAQVHYDFEKSKLTIGGEPSISVPLGMYHKYTTKIIDKLELAAITIQQIEDKERQEREERKAMKMKKKKHF